jgi:antitoxin component of MazEF toxin-antitoxin module
MSIRVSLCQVGDSMAITLPKTVLELVGARSEFELRVDGRQIVLEPVRELRKGWFDNVTPAGSD